MLLRAKKLKFVVCSFSTDKVKKSASEIKCIELCVCSILMDLLFESNEKGDITM